MIIEKRLGKIETVMFGHCGYQTAQLGIQFSFKMDSSGVVDNKAFWDAEMIECTPSSQWTEDDRDKNYVEIMRFISKLLKETNVDNVNDLQGKPVELTFDGNLLKEWRILTEVI